MTSFVPGALKPHICKKHGAWVLIYPDNRWWCHPGATGRMWFDSFNKAADSASRYPWPPRR